MKLHPLGKVEFNELENRLQIEEGVLYEDGDHVSVLGGKHIFYGAKRQPDGTYYLENALRLREITSEEKNAMEQRIKLAEPTVYEKVKDLLCEHAVPIVAGLALGTSMLYHYLSNR